MLLCSYDGVTTLGSMLVVEMGRVMGWDGKGWGILVMIVAAPWRWDVIASIGRVRTLAWDSVVVTGLLFVEDMMSAWGLIHLTKEEMVDGLLHQRRMTMTSTRREHIYLACSIQNEYLMTWVWFKALDLDNPYRKSAATLISFGAWKNKNEASEWDRAGRKGAQQNRLEESSGAVRCGVQAAEIVGIHKCKRGPQDGRGVDTGAKLWGRYPLSGELASDVVD